MDTVSTGFLKDLALVLCTAAVAAVVFQRLRQPVVLGYLLAGLVVGPHVPIPLLADTASVSTLAQLGVTLVMFSIGLEFSLRRLFDLGGSALFVTVVEVGLLFWLGFLVAGLFGFSVEESACIGAIVAVASTMMIAKLLGERSVDATERAFVLGIVVVEDLVGMLLLALLTAVVSGAGVSAAEFARSSLQLAVFLGALTAGGLLIVPRLLRWVMAAGNREATLLAAVGVCFAFSLLAQRAGYSIALGAFIAGSVTAAAGHGRILEPMVRPLRDVFGAVFFVAVGMMIDPAVVLAHWPLALVLTAVVVLAKPFAITLCGVLVGRGLAPSVRASLWLVPVGEYSFLVAEVGRGAGARGAELHSIAAAVCVSTALAVPWLTRYSDRIARAVEHRFSARTRVFETLYGTWIESLRRRRSAGWQRAVGRVAGWLVLDAALIVALVAGVSTWVERLTDGLRGSLGTSLVIARAVVIAAAGLACVPFCIGIVRASRRLAALLAEHALPAAAPGGLDLALAPRRALTAAIQLAALLAVGLPMLAAVQPFVPSLSGVIAALLVGALLAALFRRRVADLDGHFHAGAQVVLETLVRHSRTSRAPARELTQVTQLLPGLGTLTSVRLAKSSAVLGRTLAELDLHGRTGASVVCIARGDHGWIAPQSDQELLSGDVIALTGTTDEIARAAEFLGARDGA